MTDLPDYIGLCPEHLMEFYVAEPKDGALCPEPGCHEDLAIYRTGNILGAYSEELERLRTENISYAARIIELEQTLGRCAALGIKLREVMRSHAAEERDATG